MYEFARYFLWVVGSIALLVVLCRIALLKRFEYGFFACYIGLVFLQATVGLALHRYFHSFYVESYWPSQAVLVALAFAALYEVLKKVLIREHRPLRLAVKLLVTGGLILGVVALAWLANIRESTMTDSILSLQQALRLLQVGALVLAFLYAAFFRLRWSDYAFGIALGFGLYAIFDLLILELTRQNVISLTALVLLDPLAYNLTVVVWLGYLLQPEREYVVEALPHHDLHHWNAALGELLQR